METDIIEVRASVGIRTITEKCKNCNKTFYRNVEHAYKIEGKTNKQMLYFCSWHCLQEYRKTHKPKRKINTVGR